MECREGSFNLCDAMRPAQAPGTPGRAARDGARRRTRAFAAWLVAVVLAAGCDGRRDASADAEAGALPTPEEAEVRGYDPDSLAWLREGRPVEFQTRAWRPAGQPLPSPGSAFQLVGSFEGMALYAAVEDDPPYDVLFFPLGNGLWQPLEPIDAVLGVRIQDPAFRGSP